jgi:hypothetical protein
MSGVGNNSVKGVYKLTGFINCAESVWQNQKCPKKQLTFEVGAGVEPTTAQAVIMAAKTACTLIRLQWDEPAK